MRSRPAELRVVEAPVEKRYSRAFHPLFGEGDWRELFHPETSWCQPILCHRKEANDQARISVSKHQNGEKERSSESLALRRSWQQPKTSFILETRSCMQTSPLLIRFFTSLFYLPVNISGLQTVLPVQSVRGQCLLTTVSTCTYRLPLLTVPAWYRYALVAWP
jgi:hypothetical protein